MDDQFSPGKQTSTLDPLRPRVLPVDYSWIIFRSAWRLLGVQYPLLFVTFLILTIINMVLSRIEYVGPVISSIVSAFFAPGVCLIVRSIVQGKPLPLKTIFVGFQDDEITSRILPYVIANAGLSLFLTVFQVFGPASKEGLFQYGLIVMAISMIWTILVTFSVPLMVFKKMRFVDTIEVNINAFTSNIVFFVLYFGCMICLLLGTIVAFLFPFLFIGLPMLILSYYLLYASLFENLEVEKIEPKVVIQTYSKNEDVKAEQVEIINTSSTNSEPTPERRPDDQ